MEFYLNLILSCHFAWKLLVECRSRIKYPLTRKKFYKTLMSKFSHLPSSNEKYIMPSIIKQCKIFFFQSRPKRNLYVYTILQFLYISTFIYTFFYSFALLYKFISQNQIRIRVCLASHTTCWSFRVSSDNIIAFECNNL